MAERFDWVVVGAGSAGAVLAARLSEDPNSSVLLLEAGPDHTTADTPAAVAAPNFFGAMEVPGRIWPDLVAVRSAGRSPTTYVRGRGAGGSSSVNAMMGIRGTPDDYDRWARELGCPGWGWREMRTAFLAAEDDLDFGGDEWHGRGGPLPLARVPLDALAPLDRGFRQAATDLGYETCDDYHTPDATGVSRVALTMRNGRRISTNDAYLEAARGRANLTIRGDVLVDRVALDGRRAVGVTTSAGGFEAKEVVVSAGALHSPAILLRSGIGPEVGLAVGANLADHASTPGFELRLKDHGRMASTAAPVANSVVRYSSGLADAGPNDMQLAWFVATGDTDTALGSGRLFAAVMRVFSRGAVTLASDDPRVDPLVDFDLLSDDRDLLRLRDGVHRAIDLVRHPAAAALFDEVLAETAPLSALSTDDAIDAWLAETVNDYMHAAGTCRMGSVGDPAAVVDTECRVIGYDGLRVCDASVMPDVPRANTHLTTVAIAERLVAVLRR